MLHCVHTRSDLSAAIIIPLQPFDHLHDARATEYGVFLHSFLEATVECTLDHQAQSYINDPFHSAICSEVNLWKSGERLWLKVRQKLGTLGLLRLYENTLLEPFDNWLLLMNSANGGMRAFQTEKRPRSAEFRHHQIYALVRLCNLQITR